jgi:hypothetical protein
LEFGSELIDVGPNLESLLFAFGLGTIIGVGILRFLSELTLVAIQ